MRLGIGIANFDQGHCGVGQNLVCWHTVFFQESNGHHLWLDIINFKQVIAAAFFRLVKTTAAIRCHKGAFPATVHHIVHVICARVNGRTHIHWSAPVFPIPFRLINIKTTQGSEAICAVIEGLRSGMVKWRYIITRRIERATFMGLEKVSP